MPPKSKSQNIVITEVIPDGKKITKMDAFLLRIRDICRTRGLQVWGSQQLVNQIYQDLLFIYHIPRLMAQGILTLDISMIGEGKLSEISYTSLLSLKEHDHIMAAVRELWSELQHSEVKELFAGRSFILSEIAKKAAKKKKCLDLMIDIFMYISNITLEEYDSNAGYTYFKKELNKAIAKTFGQFYTPSTVTLSVVKMVDPKIGETILDPTCGSCSFLAEAANYMAKKESVDIPTTFANLYGVEIESNIYAEGIMNIFINFGILPDMKKNIIEADALIHLLSDPTQYDKTIANPPFGADAKDFKDWYFQKTLVPTKGGSSKMKNQTIINPEAKFQLPFPNTNESAILFYQVIVLKLKEGGKAGVVMSATILNDGHKDMMEWFLKCCSLEKIVINPAGTFKDQGTGIETFSFIFTKGKPTTTVKIVMLGAEDDAVRTLTLDQIKEAGWKLQLKDEEKKVAYTGVYELKKLGDVCELLSGKTNNERGVGDIPFYDSNGQIGVVNNHLFDGEFVITARVLSVGSVNYVAGKFWAGDNTINIRIKDNTSMNIRFFYYWLLSNTHLLKELSSGIKPYIRKSDVAEILMPVPPLPIQQEIVANLDRIFADSQDMKDCLAFTNKTMDLMLKDPTGKQLEDVLGGLRLKRAYVNDATSVKSQMAAVVRSVGARGFERKKLGDTAEIEGGDYITKSSETTGEYPVYGGGAASYHINRFNREPTCVINKDGMSASCVQMVTTRFFLNHHGWTLKLKSADLAERFLHWQLYFRSDEIFTLATGSCQKGLNQKEFTQFMIYIPPLPIQHEVLAILNEMEAELQILEQMAAKAEQRAKFILDGYLTSNAPVVASVASVAVSDEEESETNSIIIPPPTEKDNDYTSMTRADLLALCKERNIKGVSSKKKEELIELLSK